MAITTTNYGFGTRVPWAQDEAIERITAALKEEGFGILTTIDVQQTLKEKLGLDTNSYVILGACNPHLAHQALDAEPEIGLLLPCNVIVYQANGGTTVAVMDPAAALRLAGNPSIEVVGREAKARLERALQRLVETSA
jgi:uncharacterized protein (DUF302 family)